MINLSIVTIQNFFEDISCTSKTDLINQLERLNLSKGVWIATQENSDAEILVTDNLEKILIALAHDNWDFKKDSTFLLQKYNSFEDAYAVALQMRETNPLCYNNDSQLN